MADTGENYVTARRHLSDSESNRPVRGLESAGLRQDPLNPFMSVGRGVEFNEPIRWDFVRFPHLLIAGMSGSGKTVVAQSLITDALNAGWLVCAGDVKQVSLSEFSSSKGMQYADSVESIHAMLNEVAQMAEDPQRRTGGRQPVLVVIDEVWPLLVDEEYGKAIRVLVEQIAINGIRSAVHLVITTQRIRQDGITVLSQPTMAHMDARLLLGPASTEVAQTVVGYKRDLLDARIGFGVYSPAMGDRGPLLTSIKVFTLNEE